MAVCDSVFGLRISEGAIAAALAQLAVWASPAINSEGTGVRVDGRNWCHRFLQTPTASYHVIAPNQGANLATSFPGMP